MANFVTQLFLDSESARLEALINSEGLRARAAEAQLRIAINSEGSAIADLDAKLVNKQDKLTAGTNIIITSEGIISALGGDGKVKDVLVNGASVLDSEGNADIDLSSYATIVMLDSESVRLENLVSAESARAQALEAGLQLQITSEGLIARAAEASLRSEVLQINTIILDSEGNSKIEKIETRLPADQSPLASVDYVDSEANRAMIAETIILNSLDSESARAIAVENSILVQLNSEGAKINELQVNKQDVLVASNFGNNTGFDSEGKIETKIKFAYDEVTGVLDIFNW